MDAISIPFATLVVNVLGLPGLIFVIWHFDAKRFAAQREEYKDHIAQILDQYKDDVTGIKKLYENNVDLCRNYEHATKQWEKLDGDLAGIITLNTQILTRLVEKVDSNQFCPAVRKAGPHG
jgi:ABC-type transport system involved in cytochrome bd biosynthesis fused ATPase/permease subunit